MTKLTNKYDNGSDQALISLGISPGMYKEAGIFTSGMRMAGNALRRAKPIFSNAYAKAKTIGGATIDKIKASPIADNFGKTYEEAHAIAKNKASGTIVTSKVTPKVTSKKMTVKTPPKETSKVATKPSLVERAKEWYNSKRPMQGPSLYGVNGSDGLNSPLGIFKHKRTGKVFTTPLTVREIKAKKALAGTTNSGNINIKTRPKTSLNERINARSNSETSKYKTEQYASRKAEYDRTRQQAAGNTSNNTNKQNRNNTNKQNRNKKQNRNNTDAGMYQTATNWAKANPLVAGGGGLLGYHMLTGNSNQQQY